jgi:4'-phosphopantetheinyl transferase
MSDWSRTHWRHPPKGLVLPVDEIHVHAIDLNRAAAELANLERLLGHEERDRASRFHRLSDRRRYVVAHASLRSILGGYLDHDPERLEFHKGAHGKPGLAPGDGPAGLQFSFSRSHEMGVLAVQRDHEVGIDIERIRPIRDPLEIAERFFAAPEYQVLRSLPVVDHDAAFLRYWTRKEATVKLLGLGLSHPLDTFVLSADPTTAVERFPVAAETVTVRSLILTSADRYLVALATLRGDEAIRCWLPFDHGRSDHW